MPILGGVVGAERTDSVLQQVNSVSGRIAEQLPFYADDGNAGIPTMSRHNTSRGR